MRKTTSIDLRERILSSYDAKEGTREQIAKRFRVSLGMVKKLLQQRRRIGNIDPQHKNSGRKQKITEAHRQKLANLLAEELDLTLSEMRKKLGITCTLPAIHYVLCDMGYTLKKNSTRKRTKSK